MLKDPLLRSWLDKSVAGGKVLTEGTICSNGKDQFTCASLAQVFLMFGEVNEEDKMACLKV